MSCCCFLAMRKDHFTSEDINRDTARLLQLYVVMLYFPNWRLFSPRIVVPKVIRVQYESSLLVVRIGIRIPYEQSLRIVVIR